MSVNEESKEENIASLLEEIDDELDEFEDIDAIENQIDPDVDEWDENWDTTGWDDEDADDEFIKQLHNELQEFERKQSSNQ